MKTVRITAFILAVALLLAITVNVITASVYAILALTLQWLIEPKQ